MASSSGPRLVALTPSLSLSFTLCRRHCCCCTLGTSPTRSPVQTAALAAHPALCDVSSLARRDVGWGWRRDCRAYIRAGGIYVERSAGQGVRCALLLSREYQIRIEASEQLTMKFCRFRFGFWEPEVGEFRGG